MSASFTVGAIVIESPVLVVGATGHLGSQVVAALKAAGKRVRALVRPGSDASRLERLGVDIVRGDMLDPQSLDNAFHGIDSVITSAIGYSNRRKGDLHSGADQVGNRNLVEAANRAGIRRFVLTSILTCEQAPGVPHFWAKKLTEDALAAGDVPFVALRPGAFIDQAQDFWIDGLRRGRLEVFGNPDIRWSYVHTADLARYLAAAVDLPDDAPSRIDISCDRAVSANDIAAIMSDTLGRSVRVRALPWPVASGFLALGALFNPWLADLRNMFAYILKGGYVADTTAQRRWFGEAPRVEAAIARYLKDVELSRERNHPSIQKAR